ncbi:deoxyguanosinetriphosphate triphosphohydrolase [Mahella sp.]|uniref:deoxyguanosinetriphosphate triphosphohydrolase n=1 Tax=Mahella sp. TaxID=2798721 RepID=UPI0025BB11A6|nr:deoxyguanosinetriphosphate triphosphohydrolase [Mahella sp.]MBZ4664837.1 deoxyguanosinetriphosphate triphosphohydrolase [Mahella sp.]
MLPRERTEALEIEILSPYAALSSRSKGRATPEAQCDIRTDFQRDRDRIIHSKAFRRLKHKTQVFLSPEGDHYRTRLTHTLEVSQIARTIARALRLNEDLTEAIALGHDLGHTPFGHTGEAVLNEVCPKGFSHNVQGLRVVEVLEKDGAGLNLTWEVRDGILNHTSRDVAATVEGRVVSLADRVAYINHDIDDAIRAGIISPEDLPPNCIDILGHTHSRRINNMITDIINNSVDDNINMSRPVKDAMNQLREFMFNRVYLDPVAKKEEKKAQHVVRELYFYFLNNVDKLPDDMRLLLEFNDISDVVCDYVAGMTDTYAIRVYKDLFLPESWS